MTVLSLAVGSWELIAYDAMRWQAGATYGIAVLYPTPNRVRDQRLRFEGRDYPGTPHGAARKQAFTGLTLEAGDAFAAVSGALRCTPESDAYAQFPFHSRLTLRLCLRESSVRWDYKVTNLNKGDLGYGFAQHPFSVERWG